MATLWYLLLSEGKLILFGNMCRITEKGSKDYKFRSRTIQTAKKGWSAEGMRYRFFEKKDDKA